MTRQVRDTAGWRVKVYLDGSRLSGSYWPEPSRTIAFRHIYRSTTAGDGDGDTGLVKGRLAFALGVA